LDISNSDNQHISMPFEPSVHPTDSSVQARPEELSPQFTEALSSQLTFKPEMNVEGATVSELASHSNDTRDIVPNQTEHVSQIAIDVSNDL
jgi:hypothetical protein